MERRERNEKDETQKAKLIFISLGIVVIAALLWGFVSAAKARKERDAAVQKLDFLSQAYDKDEQLLKEQNSIIDELKKKVGQLEARVKARPARKARHAKAGKASKKAKSRKSSKKSKNKRHR
jgi:hypothetical protein